jgi:hypothetical protein
MRRRRRIYRPPHIVLSALNRRVTCQAGAGNSPWACAGLGRGTERRSLARRFPPLQHAVMVRSRGETRCGYGRLIR